MKILNFEDSHLALEDQKYKMHFMEIEKLAQHNILQNAFLCLEICEIQYEQRFQTPFNKISDFLFFGFFFLFISDFFIYLSKIYFPALNAKSQGMTHEISSLFLCHLTRFISHMKNDWISRRDPVVSTTTSGQHPT